MRPTAQTGCVSIDLNKDLPHLYRPGAADFVEVDVPPMTYLAVDGHGDPNTSPDYAQAVASLYTAGYGIRAAFKGRTGSGFVVGPLEGLWTSSDPTTFTTRDKGAWDWTMLIPLPDQIDEDDLAAGLTAAARKRPDLPAPEVRRITEGRSLQILHVGPYDEEGPTLSRLHSEVMPGRGLTWNGPHHEIYLGDPRRTAPERLRTILRQPVRPAG